MFLSRQLQSTHNINTYLVQGQSNISSRARARLAPARVDYPRGGEAAHALRLAHAQAAHRARLPRGARGPADGHGVELTHRCCSCARVPLKKHAGVLHGNEDCRPAGGRRVAVGRRGDRRGRRRGRARLVRDVAVVIPLQAPPRSSMVRTSQKKPSICEAPAWW